MWTLEQKQRVFLLLEVKLVTYAYSLGYEMAMGEAWRSDETCALYAKEGKGITNSLHPERLAKDYTLYRNGIWLKKSEDYRPLGIYWKGLSQLPYYECTWGGDFVSNPDGCHFSITHGGVR